MAEYGIGYSTSAQMSLDFLIGISVFLVAFIFVFAFIPGVFVPFISNSDEMTMTADRASLSLCSDLLARTEAGSLYPGILDAAKISAFAADMGDPVTSRQARASLGLNLSGSELYNLEVVIDRQGSSTPQVINNGETAAGLKGNIGQSKRFVYIRDNAAVGTDNFPGRMAIVTVRVW
jgi:hypothetical protein